MKHNLLHSHIYNVFICHDSLTASSAGDLLEVWHIRPHVDCNKTNHPSAESELSIYATSHPPCLRRLAIIAHAA